MFVITNSMSSLGGYLEASLTELVALIEQIFPLQLFGDAVEGASLIFPKQLDYKTGAEFLCCFTCFRSFLMAHYF